MEYSMSRREIVDQISKKPEVKLTLNDAVRQGVKTVLLQELNGNVIVVDDANHMSYELRSCYEYDHTHNGSLGDEVPLFKKRWN